MVGFKPDNIDSNNKKDASISPDSVIQQKKENWWKNKYGCDCDEMAKNKVCEIFFEKEKENNNNKPDKCLIICCIEKDKLVKKNNQMK